MKICKLDGRRHRREITRQCDCRRPHLWRSIGVRQAALFQAPPGRGAARSQIMTSLKLHYHKIVVSFGMFCGVVAFMRKISVVMLTALALVSCDGLWQDALADGVSARHAKKVRPLTHARKCGKYDRCGMPVACPAVTCYSLYGAYGPYGGALYWNRYTYAGWGYR